MKLNRNLRIPEKATIWLCVFVTGVLFFALFRLIFLLTHISSVSKSTTGEIVHSFWIGFRFDSTVLSTTILPLFLVSLLPFVKFSRKSWRIVFVTVLTAIFALMFLASSADVGFFDQFGSRINYWAIEYLEYPGYFLYSAVSHKGFWLLFALWIATTAVFNFVLRRIFRKLSSYRISAGGLSKAIVFPLMVALLAFGIRGRIGMKALDWGSAFFSDNQFINQLSLNSVFTLSHSIYEELKDGKTLFGQNNYRFAFYENDEAYQTVANMLRLKTDNSSGNFSLEYRTDVDSTLGFHPNVVIVIMESWSAQNTGALGSDLGVTPEFDRLCSQGILFKDFYANGIRTNRGLPAILCSFPSLPGRSIMKRYAADYPFRSLAQILDEYGYTSIFAYGGDIEFDNMRGFLKGVGYDIFWDESYFGESNRLGKWGVPDHIVFERLISEIDRFKRPFNLTITTLSNHEPYLLPDDRFKLYHDSVPESKQLNAFYYSDWSIGQFMQGIRQKPLYDSTIFMFTADHCSHQSTEFPLEPNRFHVPLLIHAPGIVGEKAGIIERTTSQVDMLPTLIGVLGIETSLYCWGRDQFSLPDDDSGFAVFIDEERMGLIEGSKFYFHWVDVFKKLYDLNDESYLSNDLSDSLPEVATRMDTKLNSYVQLADYLSRGGDKAR